MPLRRTQLRLERLDERWMPDASPAGLPGTTIPAAQQMGSSDPAWTPDHNQGEADQAIYGPASWDDFWAGSYETVNYGDPAKSGGQPLIPGPVGPAVPAAEGVTINPDGRVSKYPPSEGGAKISGPGRINFPVGTVIVISDRTSHDDADSNRRVAPAGTPITTGATGWDGVRKALDAQPAGKVTSLVISGHGAGGTLGGVDSSRGAIRQKELDHATIDVIKNRLAPGAPIIITGCHCALSNEMLQMLADQTGHPVIASTGECIDGNSTDGDWTRFDPKPPTP